MMSIQTSNARLDLAPPDIVEFLFHEARLLDDRLFEEWLELYTDGASMWVPTGLDQDPDDSQVSIVSESKSFMEYRVQRLRHPAIYSQLPPAQATRLVSNAVVEEAGDDAKDTVVRSSFVMVESRLEQQRFFGGHYRHRLRRLGDDWRIARKEVYLMNADATHSNLNLPF